VQRMLAWLKRKKNIIRIGRWCGWIALALMVLTALSGYGITEWRLIERITFGLLGKAGSLELHHYTDIPLAVLTLLHVGIDVWVRRSARRRKKLAGGAASASHSEGVD